MLTKGYSQASIGHNVSVEEHAGKDPKQAIAIALQTAREAKEKKAIGELKEKGK